MILKGDFYSKVLEMETKITIVAPDKSMGRPFKGAYLLHGLMGRSGDWVDYSMLPNYARNKDVVFIMPDGGRSFYSDMKYGLNYFSYITEELPAICEDFFNISRERENTFIMGASMGGYGALKCALTKPEKYGKCCAFSSPCLFLKDDFQRVEDAEEFEKFYGPQLFRDFQAIFGEGMKWDPKNDILNIAENFADNIKKPEIYLACGTDDGFYDENQRFHTSMTGLGFNSLFDHWSGGHDWFFFDRALKRALDFCLER